MLTPEEKERVGELMKKAAADLREAGCEAVQIVVCYRDADSTAMACTGQGNWYARRGMLQEILEKDKAKLLAKEIEDARE
jgi:hypothetical protein